MWVPLLFSLLFHISSSCPRSDLASSISRILASILSIGRNDFTPTTPLRTQRPFEPNGKELSTTRQEEVILVQQGTTATDWGSSRKERQVARNFRERNRGLQEVDGKVREELLRWKWNLNSSLMHEFSSVCEGFLSRYRSLFSFEFERVAILGPLSHRAAAAARKTQILKTHCRD